MEPRLHLTLQVRGSEKKGPAADAEVHSAVSLAEAGQTIPSQYSQYS